LPSLGRFSIRQARIADIPLLVRLEREFDRDERQLVLKQNPAIKPYMRASSAKFTAQRLRKWIRSRSTRVVIAQNNSTPCGYSVAWVAKNRAIFRPKRYGFVGIIFVQRDYRGRKITSLMVKDVYSWFARRGIKYVFLNVLSDNKHARGIYEKWGFGNFAITVWKTGVK
jgi:ribosomal protein S18 acetylase RimI-like enzyme